MTLDGITLIFSPYHVGIRDHRVGNGPHKIRSMGVEWELQKLGLNVQVNEIGRVDDFEGEIGRSFELIRRISLAVTEAVTNNRFPFVLAGNCMSSAAVACGLNIRDLGFIYFDAHDDLDSPDVHENGYFDAMGLSFLRGESWKALMNTVPGFKPFKYDKFLYVGLRDQSEVQKQRVVDAGMDQIRGDPAKKINFLGELQKQLAAKSYNPTLVHLDLDVLDQDFGKANDYPSPGGMTGQDLVDCIRLVSAETSPRSLTVCCFDPNSGDGDKVAHTAIRAIRTFFEEMVNANAIQKL
ncbi:hypothetical protein TRICI_003935 [Trichomonascus ciferrii]|uniref:Arginase n=1 Tax=Trichomonascus ciferrii TaxID=44093 RepID=A0A642V2I6_9ASCO|nr:hypothetical protein TRICI_003935 [Trichomonascus ciferrii]